MTSVWAHGRYDYLQAQHVWFLADQMRTQSDATQLQFVERQQMVDAEGRVHLREVIGPHMHRTHVLYAVLHSGDQYANLFCCCWKKKH